MKTMNHAEYKTKVRTLSDASLQYTIKDAKEAMLANPTSENCSYYADEVCYCADELARRDRERAVENTRRVCNENEVAHLKRQRAKMEKTITRINERISDLLMK